MVTLSRLTPAAIVATLKERVPELTSERIKKAIVLASELYGDRVLELAETMTLLEHATKCAEFLAEFCHDEDAIVACILQHALKVPDGSLEDIRKEFGRDVRDIVSRVHLISHLHTTDWRKSVEDMRVMLVSVADDARVLLIALSVACMFMHELLQIRPEFRMRLSRQALQLFAPVAARLGIYALKYRLERSAFPECYPVDAQHIGRQLTMLHEDYGAFIERTASAIRDYLRKNGIECEVMAREKQPYSIFQKMRSRSVTGLEKIMDIFAIRVVVPTLHDCYQTLGLVHTMGTPLSHRFKDYVSFPKPNGYQSLHTCLLGLPHAPPDTMVEVQIRTKDMHREAEYGIAAHWLYKQDGSVLRGAKKFQLTDVLMGQQSVGGSGDTAEQMTLVDHIYVLTPRGDIIELPEGSTPLDFAFHIHTDIGLKFKSAKVNGSIVPLSHRLENGDVVEVQTHKHPRPALQWLEELVTPSARAKLKNYFFAHNRPQFLIRGREAVNAELKTRKLPSLDNDLSLLSHFEDKALSMREREDLLVKVGMGSVRTSAALRHFADLPAKKQGKGAKQKTSVRTKPKDLVAIEGEQLDLPYRFAKCCSAEKADPRPKKILGVVTRGGVVMVHKDGCKMLKGANPERRVKMYWVA